MNREKRIYVDADGCPAAARKETSGLAKAYHVDVIFVASYNHISDHEGEIWKYVDPDKEAADLYIANQVQSGDFVITQDIGLAALLTAKKVQVLTPVGERITENNIEMRLNGRYEAYQALRAGKKVKGPSKYDDATRLGFRSALKEVLEDTRNEQ